MHVTITEEVKPMVGAAPASVPVTVTVETGDHIVITRKVDRERHRQALRRLLADMNARPYDPSKETGESILKEIRNSHV